MEGVQDVLALVEIRKISPLQMYVVLKQGVAFALGFREEMVDGVCMCRFM